MLEKVTMQRTQQFSAFVCYRKNPVKRSACVVSRKKLRLSEKLTSRRYAYFSRFHKIWLNGTLGKKVTGGSKKTEL